MDVIGIGLANIDLVAHVDDAFLARHKLRKGLAVKFDDLAFGRLRADLTAYNAIPGGCAANTICGVAATGVPTAFFGKIGGDSFEGLYRSSFRGYSVEYNISAGEKESSQCAVLVTPDGERSFAYTHGASWDMTKDDLDISALERAKIIVTEIYMFEFGQDSEVAKSVIDTAQKHKIPLVMKVMDQDFARRYAQKIKALADAGILTLLVGNHENLPALTASPDMQHCLDTLKDWKCDALMTANKNGAYVCHAGNIQHFTISPVENPKNTTGAGDQFLAGFIMGMLDGKTTRECVDYAAACARAILNYDTARPPMATQQGIRF